MGELSDNIIKKYLDNECTDKELDTVNAWIKESDGNAERLFGMEEIYALGRFYRHTGSRRTALAEKRLRKRLEKEKKEGRTRRYLYPCMKYAAAAAAALLVIGSGYHLYRHETAPRTLAVTSDKGTVRNITLPDGTEVWLNDASTLEYPYKFSDTERNVYLDGEAYFEVVKDPRRPFTVESEAMRVCVLGTVFNLKSGKNSGMAEASLIEGEIEVKGNNEEGRIILAPGQRAELDRSTRRLTVKQVDTRLDAVWHDNLIPFDKADIFLIARTLERFYHVKIVLSPDIRSDRTYSGMVKKKAAVESVLASLQNSIPFKFKMTDDKILISPAGE